ncbi:MAG TPA: hypothetical protein VEU33_37125 [Archangium sp.]|nr:hypothetical protein [Archangium sp.]
MVRGSDSSAPPNDAGGALVESLEQVGEELTWSERLGKYQLGTQVLALGFAALFNMGVPFVSPDGSGVLAFNCGGPGFLVSRERLLLDLGPRLVDLVRNVEAAPFRR